MAHLIAPDCGEEYIFPPVLEDWVPPGHPVRFLCEIVGQLKLPAAPSADAALPRKNF